MTAHPQTKAHKNAARLLVCLSVRFGLLTRPTTCSRCGVAGKIQAHHTDYSKPLDVQWLCTKCHGIAHRTGTDGALLVEISVRLTHVEAFMMRATAHKMGMTPSAFIRYAIKRYIAEQAAESAA